MGIKHGLSDQEKFERFLEVSTHKTYKGTPCMEWTGCLSHNGYGQWQNTARQHVRAHVFSYETHVDLVPKGLILDHLCRNRKCVNPKHLEPVTNKENIRRGNGLAGKNARKTHCKRGHKFIASNTYTYPSGNRECRTCRRLYFYKGYQNNG